MSRSTRRADATTLEAPAEPYDAIVWIGGPYRGGSVEASFRTLASWVRPGGQLLAGCGFWAQDPPAEYLAATGIAADFQGTHADNLDHAAACDLVPMYVCVGNRDEWDHFEGVIRTNVERYAVEHPDDPDPHGRIERGRPFYLAQQRWGRETMGFGMYLLLKPTA